MEHPRTTLKRSQPAVAVVLAAVAIFGATFLAVRAWRAPDAPPSARVVDAPPTPSASGEAPPGDDVSAAETPSLLEAISPTASFRAAIEGEFVRRWAVVIDNLAEGASPRRQLGFLGPSLPFTVVDRGGPKVIAPASYARYDDFANAVASVDAQALGRAYRALRGPLEVAYRLLGYPELSIGEVVARALERIENAPIEDGDVMVEEDGGVFLFAERRLERLREVEKHVLRMGPRNTRILQAKAREIRQALGLPSSSSRSAAAR